MEKRRKLSQGDLDQMLYEHQIWLSIGADPSKPGQLIAKNLDLGGLDLKSNKLSKSQFLNCDLEYSTTEYCGFSESHYDTCTR